MPPTRAHRLTAALAAVVLLGGLAAGCTTSKASSTGSKGYVSGDGTVQLIDLADRDDTPDIAGTTLDGKQVDVADYRGKVVVLNVWASWCAECVSEADDLVEAFDKLPNAVFLGINSNEDSLDDARAMVRTYDVPYDSLVDSDGSALLAFNGAVRPNALPTTVVLDPDGRIAALVSGVITTSTLVGLVEDIESEA